MHPLTEILGSPDAFLIGLFDQLKYTGIDTNDMFMDHICYRVETTEDYENYLHQLSTHGSIISTKNIGGRPIAVIHMEEPYEFDNRSFDIIELPAPKTSSPYEEGYEHVEFVINGRLEDFIDHHPSSAFDLKGLGKNINRDIRLQLLGCTVKFHEHSLKHVIEVLERNT